MKIKLIQVGKTHFPFVETGFEVFAGRLKHYCKFEVIDLVSRQRSGDTETIKRQEGELLLKHLQASDYLILLDERGKTFNSIQFADFIRKTFNHQSCLVFVIGGAYGFSEAVYERAQFQVSLSSMTFSHQMIRLIFAEQLYRAMTIIKGEPYHHE